jgi:AcrR family transcriptional regulator
MRSATHKPLSGRRAQAARNDQQILDAARAVFTANPSAPIAAVAERAGVGISALYRRYASKDELLQCLSLMTLRQYIAEAETALAANGDLWEAFAAFMRRALDSGTGALTLRFAGAFKTTEELQRAGATANELTSRLLSRTIAANAIRPDIVVGDLALIFEQLQSIRLDDELRAEQLRHRYLALLLNALHTNSVGPIPGPPPTWEEIRQRYDTERA